MANTTPETTKDRVIMGCIDGSSVRDDVCDYAAWIATSVGAPLKLIHTIDHQYAAAPDLSGAIGLGSRRGLLDELATMEQNRSRLLIEQGGAMMDAAKKRVIASGHAAPELCQRHGTLSESLVELEDRIRVLVLGIRGEAHDNARQAGIGHQIETIIRSLHRPILVVNGPFEVPKNIMLAYNGGRASRKALDMIAKSPLFKKTPCHIVFVGSDGQPLLDEAAAVLKDAGHTVITARLDGKIDDALAEYQSLYDIDITVMGAFSHSRVRGFLMGSFTAKMLEATQKPLLLLR